MSELDFSQFVDQYYEMDPETEDILPNGKCLQDGMVVLIEDPTKRISIVNLAYFVRTAFSGANATASDARLLNRWCKIEHLECLPDNIVTFIGVYEDGVKRQRKHTLDVAWIVRKNAVPEKGKDPHRGSVIRDEPREVDRCSSSETLGNPDLGSREGF